MIDNKLVENKLDVLAAKLSLTQEALATTKLKMSYASLRNKLTGKTKWYFDEVWKLTQILDCEMNDLLKKGEK